MNEVDHSRPATEAEKTAMDAAQPRFVLETRAERDRQDAKWGRNFVGIDRMVVVLGEEFGEVCRAQLERCDEKTRQHLLDELVQVAAVCSKMYELIQAGSR